MDRPDLEQCPPIVALEVYFLNLIYLLRTACGQQLELLLYTESYATTILSAGLLFFILFHLTPEIVVDDDIRFPIINQDLSRRGTGHMLWSARCRCYSTAAPFQAFLFPLVRLPFYPADPLHRLPGTRLRIT